MIIFRIVILAGILAAATPAAAQWWNPFSTRPSDRPRAEQTELSRPLYERAMRSLERGNNRTAERRFRRVARRYPLSDYAAQSLYQQGILAFDRRNMRRSFESFQTLLARHPEFPRFNEVVEYQFEIALSLAEGRGMRWLGIIPYRALNRSRQYFEIIVFNAPYSDYAPLALMNSARISERQGNIPEAIDALDRLINNYPASLLANKAYLELAETFSELVSGPLYDQGSTREAISYYQDFLILFPEDDNVDRAEEGLQEMRDIYARSKVVVGEYYYRHRNWYRAAEIFFNEAITIAPESESADLARRYLARIEEFRRLAAEDPDYRPPRTTWGERIFFWRRRATDLDFEEPEFDPALEEPPTEDLLDRDRDPFVLPD
ncbi:MAG: outer membrane protein assembly factor BamD [Opitutales bacterium]|nr:outer membrane protein assembly factor BamD [Opitutales bacterium]